MKTNLSVFLLISSTFACVPLPAQDMTAIPQCLVDLKNIQASPPANQDIAISEALKFSRGATCFVQLVAATESDPKKTTPLHNAIVAAYNGILKGYQAGRTDKQAGSSAGTGGTTNLVSKGVTAQALSVAAEYGGLTEAVNNQTVTVQGTLDGLPAALVRHNLFAYCPGNIPNAKDCLEPSLINVLRRVSYGVSFNTNQNAQTTGQASGPAQGTAQPVTFTASQQQISAVTGKVVLWSHRDATSAAFQKAWLDALTAAAAKTTPAANPATPAAANPAPAAAPATLDSAAAALLTSLNTLLTNLNFNDPRYAEIYGRAFADVKAAAGGPLDALERVWYPHILELLAWARAQDPKLDAAVAGYFQAMSDYRFEEDQFISSLAEKPVMTFEYDNNRPAGQTPNSVFRLIFDKGFGKNAAWSVTLNGAISIYDSSQSTMVAGASQFRDAQAGAQIQWNIPALKSMGGALSGTYYFQYQNSPVIMNVTAATPLPGITFTGLPSNASQVFTQKGDLHIAQLKFALGAGQSNVRFPIAFSYSNRTELISKPDWRGQIGVSYDFDSLFAK